MISLRPARIPGRWVEGYALDFHTESSRHVGTDDQGHPLFETRRTPAGEFLYRFKYRRDRAVVRELVVAAADFLRAWHPPVDMLVPVPASRDRTPQPVTTLAVALARETGLQNVHDDDARMEILANAHEVDRSRVQGRAVLLFDDLYRSGATMNSITAALYDAGGATAVYGLTLTRTRSRR